MSHRPKRQSKPITRFGDEDYSVKAPLQRSSVNAPLQRSGWALPTTRNSALSNNAAAASLPATNTTVSVSALSKLSDTSVDSIDNDSTKPKAKKAKKIQKKYDNQIPLATMQKIAGNYNDDTRLAESNLPDTGVNMPNSNDIQLGVLPKTKDRFANMIALRQAKHGYTDYRCNGGDNNDQNLMIDMVTNYDEFYKHDAWKNAKPNERYNAGRSRWCLFSPGHFDIAYDASGYMIIECTRCDCIFTEDDRANNRVSVQVLAFHANSCPGNIGDFCTCGKANPTSMHVNKCTQYNDDAKNMLCQIEYRLLLSPDDAANVGKTRANGRRISGITSEPIRSKTEITADKNGNERVKSPFMKEDELVELCQLYGIDPTDPNILALLDKEKTKKVHNYVKYTVTNGYAGPNVRRHFIRINPGYAAFFNDEDLSNGGAPQLPNSNTTCSGAAAEAEDDGVDNGCEPAYADAAEDEDVKMPTSESFSSPKRTIIDEWTSLSTPIGEDKWHSNNEEVLQRLQAENGGNQSPLDSPVAIKQSTPDPFGGACLNLSPDSDEEITDFMEI
eukprot:scaffold8496_cov66-Cyclotella_meneghiniana.AAC.10